MIIIVINHYHYQYQLSSPWPGGAYLRLAHAVRLHPHSHLEQPDHHGPQQVSIYQKSEIQIGTDVIFCSPGPVCNLQPIQSYLVCLLQLIFSV